MTLTLSPSHSLALDHVLLGCTDHKNCVSTKLSPQIESNLPPWTYVVSPEEAFARIKGVLTSENIDGGADGAIHILEVDEEARYIRASVSRVWEDQDEVEFLVRGKGVGESGNEDSKVVLFRSCEKEDGWLSDFGANKRRIERMRKRGAVFDWMDDGSLDVGVGDATGRSSGGNGPLGQLKAFYGLQSGQGFENVFEDE